MKSFYACVDKHNDKEGGTLKIFRPGNKVWYTSYDARYYVILQEDLEPASYVIPFSVADLQAALRCSDQSGINISIRSGGHSFAGAAHIGDTGVIIDMSKFRKIKFDEDTDSMTIGAGHRLGEGYRAAWDYKESLIPAGTCPGVGVPGFTLGGGYGSLTRKYGYLSDNIISAKAVSTSGEALTINRTMHPDLLWAIKGGGGAHVVVYEFTFQTYRAPNTMTECSFYWPINQMAASLKSILDGKPWNLHANVSKISFDLATDQVKLSLAEWNAPNGNFLMKYFDSLDAPKPTSTSCKTYDWQSYVLANSNPSNVTWDSIGTTKMLNREYLGDTNGRVPPTSDEGGPMPYKASSWAFNKTLSPKAQQELVRIAEAADGVKARTFSLKFFGGDVLEALPIDGALPHHDSIMILGIFAKPANTAEDVKWVEDARDSMEQYSAKTMFFNFMDCGVEDKWKKYFGGNAEKVLAVKKRWDPKNKLYVFCNWLKD